MPLLHSPAEVRPSLCRFLLRFVAVVCRLSPGLAAQTAYTNLPHGATRRAGRGTPLSRVLAEVHSPSHGPIMTVGHPMAMGLGPPGISTTISMTRHAIWKLISTVGLPTITTPPTSGTTPFTIGQA